MNATCPCSFGLVDPIPEPIRRYRVTRGKDGRVRIQYAASTRLVAGQGGKLASSRSKTGDPSCSKAVSDWKTSGQTPTIAKKLAECRAMARGKARAHLQAAAGHEARAQHIEHILKSGGPITAKARKTKAKMLREVRARANEQRKARKEAEERDKAEERAWAERNKAVEEQRIRDEEKKKVDALKKHVRAKKDLERRIKRSKKEAAELRDKIQSIRIAKGNPAEAMAAVSEWIDRQPKFAKRSIQAHDMQGTEDLTPVYYDGMEIWHSGETSLGSPIYEQIYELAMGAGLSGRPMPSRLVEVNKAVVLTKSKSGRDAYWAEKYNVPYWKSPATGGDGRIVAYNGLPMRFKLFAHEAGHNLAYNVYGNITPKPGSDYAKAMASGEKPVSDYAKVNPAEDFAEAVSHYAMGDLELRSKHPERWKVIDRLMKDKNYAG